MQPNDPRALITTFVLELPKTIRTEILLFLIIYGMDRDIPDNIEEFEKVVLDHVAQGGMSGIGAVIRLGAVLDHQLSIFVANVDDAEEALKAFVKKQPENQAILTSYLSLPMRAKHWQQALSSWRELRATKLTPQNLRDFASSLLTPRYRQ